MTEPVSTQFVIEVPAELGAEVGAALRNRYPEVTTGTSTDGEAARAVFAWLVASILADYAAEQVRQDGQDKVKALADEIDAQVRDVRAQTWAKIQSVINVPPPPRV